MATICKECGEPIPPFSRVCPYCLVNDSFSVDIQEFETPVEMLSIMKSSLEEYLSAPSSSIWDKGSDTQKSREALATFECVRDVVMLSFGKNSDVSDAVVVMEDLLYERVEQRKKRHSIRQLSAIIVSAVLFTTLIFSLFVLIY
ncbi:MAG: zinc ribbon domain-containing protein [Rikenellaceae bacterium]